MIMRALAVLILIVDLSGFKDSRCDAINMTPQSSLQYSRSHHSKLQHYREDGGKKKAAHSVLSIRGGAGPLDPVVMSKITTGVLLAQSVGVLAPQKLCEPYGVDPNELNINIVRRIQVTILSVSLMSYMQLFRGDKSSLNDVVFHATLPWLIESIYTVINDKQTPCGFKLVNFLPVLFASSFTAIATYRNGDMASKAITFWSWFGIVSGFTLFPFGEFGAKFWGSTVQISQNQCKTLELLGAWILGYGLQLWAISNGEKTAPMALGLAILTPSIQSLRLMVTGEMDKVGFKKGPGYIWLAFFAVVLMTVLF